MLYHSCVVGCAPVCAQSAASFVTGHIFTWSTHSVIILFLLY